MGGSEKEEKVRLEEGSGKEEGGRRKEVIDVGGGEEGRWKENRLSL